MQNLNNLLPKMNCLHGTVLYVRMYLIFLYEVCLWFCFFLFLAVVTYVCCSDAYSVTPHAPKEQNKSYVFQNKSQMIFHV